MNDDAVAPLPTAAACDMAGLAASGYTTVSLLDAELIASCRAVVDSVPECLDHSFFASPAHAWGPTARRIDQTLKGIVGHRIRHLFPGFEPFMCALTTKTGGGQEIKYHQDWSYTDERVHPTLFLWCPLVDVDGSRGGLRVVPGSHRWVGGLRPSRSIEATEYLQEDFEERAADVPLSVGRALVFLPSTIHGSGPNPADDLRPALTIAIAPTGCQLIHFHLDDEGTLSGHRVDEAFFTENPYGTRPTGYPPLEPWRAAVTESDLAELLAVLPPGRPPAPDNASEDS